jgi:hypothetical protein
MRGAVLNPIRFYDSSAMPDWLTVFPNNDNVTYGNYNQFGVLPSPEFLRFHYGDMYLQFLNEDNEVKSFDLYKLNETNTWVLDSNIDSVDISPVGWVGNQIHKITLTGLTDGCYYLFEPDCNCKSDIFYMTSSIDFTEDFVKIKYSNSINDFGCIFGTHYFEVYFRGRLMTGEPKIDVDSYEDDRSNPIKLKASPQRTANLSILGINYLYKDLIDHIFSCDTIEVNGVQYENMDAPAFDLTEGSDMGNITVKLAQSINDYYYGKSNS